ncbi:hypothetical protein MIR68_010198 [Amoeboaphelidium protococcarum]|nr:hypothetical protein MIR68_010198 [Amoeboaphelidium protococcarum]
MKIFCLIFGLACVSAFSSRSGLCFDDPNSMENGMGGIDNALLEFTLSVDRAEYGPNQSLDITIGSNTNQTGFKGILLYARVVSGKYQHAHVGQFQIESDSNAKKDFTTLDKQCENYGRAGSTLSHANSNLKKLPMVLTWIAPATQDLGDLEFRGIIVGKEKTSWMTFTPVKIRGKDSGTPQVETSVPPVDADGRTGHSIEINATQNDTESASQSEASSTILGSGLSGIGVAILVINWMLLI